MESKNEIQITMEHLQGVIYSLIMNEQLTREQRSTIEFIIYENMTPNNRDTMIGIVK